MKEKSKQAWIKQGYEMISEHGFSKVNVEAIARVMNKSKSSFYHYFGDWEGFEKDVLEYHLKRAKAFAIEANKCESIIPGMLNLFLAHKADIFFHKQLRINREKPHYKRCFESAYGLFEHAILDEWIAFLKLEDQSFLAAKILTLVSENFLLQITHKNYNYPWLKNYLLEVSKLLLDITTQTKGK
jgi:AcrR family transcriptional regulator